MFFVKNVKKPTWSSVVATKQRNLFAMPDAENEDEIDSDSIDVAMQGINLVDGQDHCQTRDYGTTYIA